MSQRRNEPNRGAIYATAIAAYLAIAGIAVVDPILPAIGEAIGVSPWQVELLFTAYIAVMGLGMIPAVLATGKFGFKKVLITGVTTVGLAAILAAFSQNIGQLATLRGVWGLGNAMFFATAMVIMIALAKSREWVVGLFETALGLGFATGPLIGGLLGEVSWRLPFFACGVFMLIALAVASTRLREPAKQPPVKLAAIGQTFQRKAFIALCAVTATYNFAFFIVLGYAPLALHLDVVPLGLAFTGWGLGLAVGILGIGHRLAHRIGAVQTVGIALTGLLLCLVGFALSTTTPEKLVILVISGLCMGLANALLTDLALGLGSADRRVATGAFNLVRWGAAAPAPVVAGLLVEHSTPASPFWVGAAVLAVGVLAFLLFGKLMAHGIGEGVFWARLNAGARTAEHTPEEVVGEAY
ncbi:MAG: MFS transporter [Hamadaea sp.]|uniref:MFS transporter n=1 Tax=Hamadaea sp. NPDC050747 TaxID=3155789 RepID=UPI0017C3B664|nr:MFS transporter [Hamadaea sp.]NUR50752.1 MFS transporter [Hamadaea sp.]NUT02634.1 MFS transporter [Hamadaea sp.]